MASTSNPEHESSCQLPARRYRYVRPASRAHCGVGSLRPERLTRNSRATLSPTLQVQSEPRWYVRTLDNETGRGTSCLNAPHLGYYM